MNVAPKRNGTTVGDSRLSERLVKPVSDGKRQLAQKDEIRQLLADSERETPFVVRDVLQAGLEEVKAVTKQLEEAGGEVSYKRTIEITDGP